MKSTYLASTLFCAALTVLALPTEAQACPYRLVSEYGYNIRTGQPEMRTVYRVDYARCGQNNPAGSRYPTGYGITVSTPDGGPLNVYAQPSFNSQLVGTISNGSDLPLTGNIHNRDWFETMNGNWVYKHHAR